VRNILLQAICLFLFSFGANAQMEIVEIEKPQPAKSVAGVVADPSGVPIAGVKVEERSADWKTVLRSTETDEKGRFSFSATPQKTLYQLQLGYPGFNWLRITLKLDKKAGTVIAVKMTIAT
jgi:Carboxypeptidase regulatory-like domain